MPRHGGKKYVLVKGAEEAMEHFKLEVAEDLGFGQMLADDPDNFKKFTTEQVGFIGGEMVRRIQAAGEWAIKARYDANEPRLMPAEIIPPKNIIRDVSNNGNNMAEVSKGIEMK